MKKNFSIFIFTFLFTLASLLAKAETPRSEYSFKALEALHYCGVDYIDFYNYIKNINLGIETIPQILLKYFKNNKETYLAYCETAQWMMDSLKKNYGEWDLTEARLVYLINFAKIGILLHVSADKEGLGIANSTFNSCQTSVISDENIEKLIFSYRQVMDVESKTSEFNNYFQNLNSYCTNIGLQFCSQTLGSSISELDIKNMRGSLVLYATGGYNPLIGLNGFFSVFNNFLEPDLISSSDPGTNKLWQCDGLAPINSGLGCCND